MWKSTISDRYRKYSRCLTASLNKTNQKQNKEKQSINTLNKVKKLSVVLRSDKGCGSSENHHLYVLLIPFVISNKYLEINLENILCGLSRQVLFYVTHQGYLVHLLHLSLRLLHT